MRAAVPKSRADRLSMLFRAQDDYWRNIACEASPPACLGRASTAPLPAQDQLGRNHVVCTLHRRFPPMPIPGGAEQTVDGKGNQHCHQHRHRGGNDCCAGAGWRCRAWPMAGRQLEGRTAALPAVVPIHQTSSSEVRIARTAHTAAPPGLQVSRQLHHHHHYHYHHPHPVPAVTIVKEGSTTDLDFVHALQLVCAQLPA